MLRSLRRLVTHGLMLTLAGSPAAKAHAEQPAALKVPAPEFREVTAWINSEPVRLEKLRGQVVVVHFWTYG